MFSLNSLKFNKALIVVPIFLFAGFFPVYAQNSLTLSVTPPLFRLNIEKGESWSSSLRVVNNNPYDITVYPTVVNFESDGEAGHGSFIPVLDADKNNTDLLANWINLGYKQILIPKEQSSVIPFTVKIPQNASPGGHYAAILVGTKPPSLSDGGASVGVSSFVTSLLLVRVGGEVIEKGSIREFSTDRSFYDKPRVSFDLRFENAGNVHIIPRGDITIYNMWGKERGKIYINKSSDFGNVLPDSIRKFSFTWESEDDSFEIGRYSAVAALSFGAEDGQTLKRTVNFWVIPLGPTLKFAAILVAFAMFLTFSIKAYVRRALNMYGKNTLPEDSDVDILAMNVLTRPIKEGIVDLRRISGVVPEGSSIRKKKKSSLSGFLSQYKKALLFIFLIILSAIYASVYLIEVRSPSRNYTVSTDDAGNDPKADTSPDIKILSGHNGEKELEVKKLLERNGIEVRYLEKSSEKLNNSKPVVKYIPEYSGHARLIGSILEGDVVLEEVSDQEFDIIIMTAEDVNKD